MVNIKQQVKELLDRLPEDCSVEDVLYHLYVIEKIRRRMELVGAGQFVPQDEAEARLSKWLIP